MSSQGKSYIFKFDPKYQKFIFLLLVFVYLLIWHLFWYANTIDLIEEFFFFGSDKTLELLFLEYDFDLFELNLGIFNIFPEIIIDILLKYIITNPYDFFIIKIFYKFSFFVFILILVAKKLNPNLNLIHYFFIAVFALSTQSLSKIHWDNGSYYSVIYFLLFLQLFLNSNNKNTWRKIFFLTFFTLPAILNPPNFFASLLFTSITFYTLNKYYFRQSMKASGKLLLISYFFWIAPVALYTKISLGSSFGVQLQSFRLQSPSLPTFDQVLSAIQGFGFWWTNSGFINGTPYWSLAPDLTNSLSVLLRIVLICLLLILILQKSTFSTLKLYMMSYLFLSIVLSTNAFNLIGVLQRYIPLISMYREPMAKFLKFYSLIFLILFFILLFLNKTTSIKIFINLFFSFYIIWMNTILFNSEFKKIKDYYPNPTRNQVNVILEDIRKVDAISKTKNINVCILKSGLDQYDYLFRNLYFTQIKFDVYNNIKYSEFFSKSCSSANLPFIYLVINPPLSQSINSAKYSTDCQPSRLEVSFLITEHCSLIKTDNISIFVNDRFLINPNIKDYNFPIELPIYTFDH